MPTNDAHAMRLDHIGREPAHDARFREEAQEHHTDAESPIVDAARLDDIRIATLGDVLLSGFFRV